MTHYKGDYQYYLDKTAATSARAALTSTNVGKPAAKIVAAVKTSLPQPSPNKEAKREEAEQRQAKAKELRDKKSQVDKLEKEIALLEKRRLELTAELENPETYAKGGAASQINRELMELEETLGRLNASWEAASTHFLSLQDGKA
ncbi:MAG: transporter related [Verrucomicrobiales bacterium]|nr:transporter related [Verrucomicrobiales bacterium]